MQIGIGRRPIANERFGEARDLLDEERLRRDRADIGDTIRPLLEEHRRRNKKQDGKDDRASTKLPENRCAFFLDFA